MTTFAIVHDYLTQRGGAERVVLALARAFPGAPIYTSVYEPTTTFPEFAELDVRTSPLQRVKAFQRDHRLALPFYAPVFSSMKVDADVVICNSSGWSHGVRTKGRKVVYCHAPARWLYQRDRYLGEARRGVVGVGLQTLAPALRAWDRSAAHSACLYLANSSASQTMIRNAYGIEAPIVHCPYGFDPDGSHEPVPSVSTGALLCVSRLLPYKNVAAVIEAAALCEQPLVVVGSGPDHDRLHALAGPNVSFLEDVSDSELRWLYANASFLVGASYEDFGLTPIEAAAQGVPSLVLGAGGYLDTVVDGVTGIYFDDPSGTSIARAIEHGLSRTWDCGELRAHAAEFSPSAFETRFRRLAGFDDDTLVPSDVSPRRTGRRVALMPSAFHPSLGGVEELTARLALEQQRNGGDPLVASMRWPRDLPVRETINGVPIWRGRFCLPEPDLRSIARFLRQAPVVTWSLTTALRRHKVDIVHVQCVSSNGLFAWLVASLLRVPLVVSLQGELTMDDAEVYSNSRTLPWVLRQLLRRAHAVTACSAHALAEAETFTGLTLGTRGTVIHNGVSLHELDTAVPEHRGRPYLLAIGRHVRQKGFDVLIEAFALTDLGLRHDLVIAGDGPERQRLEQLAVERGVAEAVVFVGRTDRVRTAALFRGCEVFVLPSRHEPMGIVNLEAMASAKPVIATRVGGVPEIVIDGETGVLVAADDPKALAEALMAVLDNPERCESMGRAGRSRAEQFDWSVIAARYDDVYQRAHERQQL